jgi:hypothetical protein
MTEQENTMHDNCKNVILFHNNWCKFLKNLKGVLPELGPIVKDAVTYYKGTNRIAFLQEVITTLSPHIKYISEYDESIFSTDYTTPLKLTGLVLLPKMDFMTVWQHFDSEDFVEDPKLASATKRSIFNHLQIIYISANTALEQISAFDKALEKQKEFMMNMLANMELDDKLKERIEEMKADELKNGASQDGLDIKKLGELFGEDNFVYQLAKEVSEELGLGSGEVSNPMGAVTSLFANGSKKLKELIITLEEKIITKARSGEFSEEKMRADAMKAKQGLSSIVGKIPGLSKLLNSDNVMSEFREKYETLSPEDKERFNQLPDLLNKDSLSWSSEDHVYFSKYVKEFHPDIGRNEMEEDLPSDDQHAKTKNKKHSKRRSK